MRASAKRHRRVPHAQPQKESGINWTNCFIWVQMAVRVIIEILMWDHSQWGKP
jgi:hypothetical protein